MPVWFLAIFDRSMFSFPKLRLYFLPFFKAKMPKMCPKITKMEIRPKLRPEVINSLIKIPRGSAQRVGFFNIGSGWVLDKIPGSGSGSGQVGVSKNTIGY